MLVKRGQCGGEWFIHYMKRIVLLPTETISSLPGPWRDFKCIALEESPATKDFFENISIRLGDSNRVRFWLDVWAYVKPLNDVFPVLFRLSSQQREIIANMGWIEGQLWR